jgi:hypothetical protein
MCADGSGSISTSISCEKHDETVGRRWEGRSTFEERRGGFFFHFYIFWFTNDTMAFPSGICICICVFSVTFIPAASQSIYLSIYLNQSNKQ